MTTVSMPVSQLRAHLAAVIASVEGGRSVLLTRHDRVVAALIPPNAQAPTPLEARAAELAAELSREGPGKELPQVVAHPAIDPEEWVASIMGARG